jgi:CYTH domain-containing protein
VAIEIERKFLVASGGWRERIARTIPLRDGLLAWDNGRKVRVRCYGDRYTLAVKGRRDGARREEYEYEIPAADADGLFRLCGERILEKTRYIVPWQGSVWEVDVYRGLLDGVVIAEIELPDAAVDFVRPHWLGREVTGDPKYKKINMVAERLSNAAAASQAAVGQQGLDAPRT